MCRSGTALLGCLKGECSQPSGQPRGYVRTGLGNPEQYRSTTRSPGERWQWPGVGPFAQACERDGDDKRGGNGNSANEYGGDRNSADKRRAAEAMAMAMCRAGSNAHIWSLGLVGAAGTESTAWAGLELV